MNILPAHDKLGLTEMVFDQVQAKTVQGNPLVANNNEWGYLGFNKDPYGSIHAGFCARFAFEAYADEYSDLPDEIRNLGLSTNQKAYLQLYCLGDTSASSNLTVMIYQLIDTMPDSKYLPTDFDVSKYILEPSIVINNINNIADTIIKIPLPISLFDELFSGSLDSTTLMYPDSFVNNFFKGLYITTDTNSICNSILKIPVIRPENGIFITYTNSQGIDTSLQLIFKSYLSSSGAYWYYNNIFNHFTYHSYSDPSISSGEKQFIQTLGSSYSAIDLSKCIESLKDSMPLLINSAELQLYRDASATDISNNKLLSKLEVKYLNNSSTFQNIGDIDVTTSGYFSRNVHSDGWFSLNLSTHVQSYLEGKISHPEIYITPSDTANHYFFQKLILLNDSVNPIKIKLVYHKL